MEQPQHSIEPLVEKAAERLADVVRASKLVLSEARFVLVLPGAVLEEPAESAPEDGREHEAHDERDERVRHGASLTSSSRTSPARIDRARPALSEHRDDAPSS